MSWVRTIKPEEATGTVLGAYESIPETSRSAKVLQSTSIRPRTMAAFSNLGQTVSVDNFDSGLSQFQLEIIGATVSSLNECRY
ncbi:MAG TPA: hypothetical protein QGF35_04555 [Dehalococcoidia bacterium]|nr:hypothetical protein [Dehalococcoidia bacterium]